MHFPLDDDERRMGTEYGRKLRPLMPRPMMMSKDKMMMMMLSPRPSYSYSASSSSCSCSCIRNPNPMPMPMPLVSTRWNPTPEQLQALEDMYRRGVRTPSAEQIQQIASKLRRFGKIEGKNVFYWFQNHKARERQKKRRQLTNNLIHALQSPPGVSSSRRSTCEAQDSASMQAGAVITPDLRQDEWTQLQHKKKKKKKKMMMMKNIDEEQTSSSSNQTLHLFPIVASTSLHDAPSTIQTKFTPNQFIEFLPTKN